MRSLAAAGARRLVDFTAGLAVGPRGSLRRVANRVFLLYGAVDPAAAPERTTPAARRRRPGRTDTAAEGRNVLDDPGEAV